MNATDYADACTIALAHARASRAYLAADARVAAKADQARHPASIMSLEEFIDYTDPCEEGLGYLRSNKPDSLADLWETCPRADWMLWGLGELRIESASILRDFAFWCVRRTPLLGGGVTGDLITDPVSLRALRVSELYVSGKSLYVSGKSSNCEVESVYRGALCALERYESDSESTTVEGEILAAVCTAVCTVVCTDPDMSSAHGACTRSVKAAGMAVGRKAPEHELVRAVANARAFAMMSQADQLRAVVPNPFLSDSPGVLRALAEARGAFSIRPITRRSGPTA